jgi:hypothetical protein
MENKRTIIKQNSAQNVQDKIFKKMLARKKLAILNQFSKFAKTLQALNDRKLKKSKSKQN